MPYLWLPSESFPWLTCLRHWSSVESMRAYLESRPDIWRELLRQLRAGLTRNRRWLPEMVGE